MSGWTIDSEYLIDVLQRLLLIHSPAGYTDPIVREVCKDLEELGIDYEITRRGAVRANLPGQHASPDRAIVAHVDTLGAMVCRLKENGRLAIVPVGTWSARFAEGARVSVFTDTAIYRGTILPLKASGHAYNDAIDTQPSTWDNLEIRIDEPCFRREHLEERFFRVGDFVGVDAQPEFVPNGYINARHLDDKAGVACLLAMAKAIRDHKLPLAVDCHLLFTISEEVGSGASAVLHGDVAEMVTVDNGVIAPGQNSTDQGVTMAMADSSGPFDFHLTHHLLRLCRESHIHHARDIFRYYRSDSASALEAGNDIRTALVTFGLDATHGWERTHVNSLVAVSQLLVHYAQTELIYSPEKTFFSSVESFPDVRSAPIANLVNDPEEAAECDPTTEPQEQKTES